MIFNQFSPESRVWLFIANQKVSSSQIKLLHTRFSNFCETWKSHGTSLHGEIKFIYDQLIAFGVNQENLCGRSVDALVRFVRESEDDLDLLNRNRMGYLKNNVLNPFLFHEIKNLKINSSISSTTMITNNFIEKNGEDLFIPLGQSPFRD
tara:strand:- start:1233 stop:1682 length:450 start_codon:yes stop_codon:yes gene_type:complete